MTVKLGTILVSLGLAVGASACGGSNDPAPATGSGASVSTATIAARTATAKLRAMPVPDGQASSSDFSVRARVPGGVWRDIGVYATAIDLHAPSTAAMALLQASGPVEISVTALTEPMRTVRVRPGGAGIRPVVSADQRTATFTMRGPGNLSVEPNDDTHGNLQLFVNPIQADAPTRSGPGVIYYGPGIHDIPGDHVVKVPSDTTVEIAAGAVVHGAFTVGRARNVIVGGSGVIDPSPYFNPEGDTAGVFVNGSSNVGVRDITILRGQNGGVTLTDARDVVVENVKEINADRYSDGIDIMSSHNVLVEGCFLRTSDDSIAIWATSPWIGAGSTSDVTVRNTVLWPDLAHGVLIGPFGKASRDESISGIDFQNVDVLEQNESNPQYAGALALNAGDNLALRDIRFDDVRIDHIPNGHAFDVRVFTNPDYRTAPGRSIRNVLFRNVTVPAEPGGPSVVSGYSADRTVDGVVFENVRREGGPAWTSAVKSDVDVGPFAENVVFQPRRAFAALSDRDPTLRYTGRWTRGRGLRVAHTAGAAVAVRFTGRGARFVGTTGPSNGKFAVYLDGRRVRTIDTYSGHGAADQLIYDTGTISAGTHTLRLRVTGTRNILSHGSAVGVSGVDVIR